jgi:cytochrome c553
MALHPPFRRLPTRLPGKHKFGFIALGAFLALALVSIAQTPSSKEDAPPPWAYPVDPPAVAAPKDDGAFRHVPDSLIGLTLSQVKDGFVSPDWHPGDHPPMPEIVVHGRKPAVMACGYCHRASGTGGPENASLAGLPAAYLIQQMADFKSGARQTSVPMRAPPKNMIALAKLATDAEIEEAAAYFSSLKLKPIIRVVETDKAPTTHVHGWHLADLKNGESEPIGHRVIEVPEDLEQFISRDSRSQFIAYVPPGSIEKGKSLANTGGEGRTVQCAICHGPDLRGGVVPVGIIPGNANAGGPVPGIAGRSPSYIVRQLYDIQHGARAGSGSAFMKPTVEKLTMDDMIALAAYAGSLPP